MLKKNVFNFFFLKETDLNFDYFCCLEEELLLFILQKKSSVF